MAVANALMAYRQWMAVVMSVSFCGGHALCKSSWLRSTCEAHVFGCVCVCVCCACVCE